jgi:hypothetical protein
VQRARRQSRGITIAVWMASVIAGTVARPANAQFVYELDGTLALQYTEFTPYTSTDSGLMALVTPAVTLQVGTPDLVYRVGYLFAGVFNLYGGSSNSYNNRLSLALAAQPNGSTVLTTSVLVSQGRTVFQLSQRPADAGQPAIRPQDNADQLWIVADEACRWDLSASLRLTQGFAVGLVAPDYSFAQANAEASASIALDHDITPLDAIGGVFTSRVALLRPLGGFGDPYYALANSLLGRWAVDLGRSWNAEVSGGIAHMIQLTGAHPEAFLPTGAITAGFLASDIGRSGGSIGVSYGPYFDLQTGGLTRAASATARGHVNFDALAMNQLAFSAGYLRSWAANEAAVLNLAALGQAVQGDVGLVWGLSNWLLATARASVAYQYDRPVGLAPSLVYTFILGVTGRYSNATHMPDMPTMGSRVDGADAAQFPGATGPR